MSAPNPDETLTGRVQRKILGKPRDVTDPHALHKISLIAFLAWVGLGADGLSSSAYGPEEAFRALGDHHYLALLLAVATGITVVFRQERMFNRLLHNETPTLIQRRLQWLGVPMVVLPVRVNV